jgi:ABC-type transport system involved in multi-copper enzyme maturation permease subunit
VKAALLSEFRKSSTTRTWWLNGLIMSVYMLVMAVIMAAVFSLSARAAEDLGAGSLPGGGGSMALDPWAAAASVYTLAVALGYIFPAVLGAMVVTTEFRHRTITPTLLAEPRRTVVLGSKFVAVLPFALVVAFAGVVGTVVGGATTSLVGVGFGSVLTNQVAAIVVLLVFTQFVEPLLRLLLAQFDATATISKFLPGAAGEAIAGSSLYSSSGLADLLEPWQGALVLLGYAVVLIIVGRLTTFRRDIG